LSCRRGRKAEEKGRDQVCSSHEALQIEDLIAVPDILPDLYGTRKGRKVSVSDVETYLSGMNSIKEKCAKAMHNHHP